MRRIFTDKIEGITHTLTGETHKHLTVVLRAKIGQAVELCCGDGYVYTAETINITKNETLLKITDSAKDTTEPNIKCDLFLGIIKGDHLEIALQKVTELGINAVYPIITDHTVKTDLNIIRATKIMTEAASQCGRGKVPVIHNPAKISAIYKQLTNYGLVVYPYENALKPSLNEFLTSKTQPKSVAIIIGPEGGFSQSEAEALGQITTPISLGNRILRADTACIATLSAIMYHFDELKRNRA